MPAEGRQSEILGAHLKFFAFPGLCNKKLRFYEESLESFFKLQSIVRNHPQVMYQIANLYEKMGDINQAVEWYFQV